MTPAEVAEYAIRLVLSVAAVVLCIGCGRISERLVTFFLDDLSRTRRGLALAESRAQSAEERAQAIIETSELANQELNRTRRELVDSKVQVQELLEERRQLIRERDRMRGAN